MGKKREAYNFFVKNLKERDRLENLGIDREFYSYLNKSAWTGLIWYKIGTKGELL